MKSIKLFIGLCLFGLVTISYAAPVTCGSAEREATLDSANGCVPGLGNPMVSDIDANFASVTGWSNQGELTDDGTNQFLSASLTSGSWGSASIAGDWSIDASFWDLFGQAVISMHVGNGGGDPDYFSWLIVEGETTGTWEYERLLGGGGGLSNLKLWGADLPERKVPAPAIILLLGLGLIGLSVSKKYKK